MSPKKITAAVAWPLGKLKSEEHCKNLSIARLENPTRYWLGKKRPEISGENSSVWISDRTLLKDDHRDRGGSLSRDWSRRVKNRDNEKCKINNSDCEGRLESHHILGWKEYPELRYAINNGITLCHAHHPKKRVEEKRMVSYFMELLSVSK